jgi:hypothetical protein
MHIFSVDYKKVLTYRTTILLINPMLTIYIKKLLYVVIIMLLGI